MSYKTVTSGQKCNKIFVRKRSFFSSYSLTYSNKVIISTPSILLECLGQPQTVDILLRFPLSCLLLAMGLVKRLGLGRGQNNSNQGGL